MAVPMHRLVSVACRTSPFSAGYTSIVLQSGCTTARHGLSATPCCAYSTSSRRIKHLGIPSTPSHPRPRFQQRDFYSSPYTSSKESPSPKTTYGISASFTAKDRRYNPSTHIHAFSHTQLPPTSIRKDKRQRPASGQDSFFISRIASTSDIALGVADGVGGWADSGVDPADFSHGFCEYMAAEAAGRVDAAIWEEIHKSGNGDRNANETKGKTLTPRSLMQRGYELISRDPSVPAGGSTALVSILRSSGTLEVANLGDSGFIQLRSNAIHAFSEPQTHAFNTPYQLSVIPDEMMKQAEIFGGQRLCDMPSDAETSVHDLRHGDVVVWASDGVWDNLSRWEILRAVSRIMVDRGAWVHTDEGVKVGASLSSHIGLSPNSSEGSSATEEGERREKGRKTGTNLQTHLAIGITSEAKAASVNTKVDGPFAREVQRYYPRENWRGGKVDDICVVVAVVCEEGR